MFKDVLNFLNNDSSSRNYTKFLNTFNYTLNDIKELKKNNASSYINYTNVLGVACKYNSHFAKKYFNSLINFSTLMFKI